MPLKLWIYLKFVFYWLGTTILFLIPVAIVDELIPGRTGQPLPGGIGIAALIMALIPSFLIWKDWKREKGYD